MTRFYLRMLFTKKRILMILITSLIITTSTIMAWGESALKYNDLLMLEFYGVGQNDFSILRFLTTLVYNGVPIYLICYFLEKDSERSIHITIRMKYQRRWMYAIVSSSIVMIICYVFISLAVTTIIAFVFRMDFSNYNLLESSPSILYLAISVGKILELSYYFSIIFLIYCYCQKATIAFICLQVGYFIQFIPTIVVKYLPIGLGSLARLQEFTNSGLYFWQVVIYLIVAISLLLGYIRIVAHKKIFI